MAITTGPRNLITDVPGLRVGQAADAAVRTGVSVILAERPAVAGVHVGGGGPGTRETDALHPTSLVGQADAIVFSGGSVYGLEAASGVTAWLGARGRGFPVPGSPRHAPIVPAAILFDLNNGGDKDWGEFTPYDRLGREAVAASGIAFELGSVGAGYGARAGAYKGGVGSASCVTADGLTVGAYVAVNAFGSPVMPGSKRLWAAPFEANGEMGSQEQFAPSPTPDDWPADTKTALAPPPQFGTDTQRDGAGDADPAQGTNTTLAVVATGVPLTSAQATRLAIMAKDGMARAIRPIHTPFDGDIVFALSTGALSTGDLSTAERAADTDAFTLARLGTLAADCLARAIGRAMVEADGLGIAPAYRDLN